MNAVIIVLICSFLLVLSLSYLVISSLIFEIRNLKSTNTKSIKEILEIATSEQIVEEINKREGNPIILVKVHSQGILVDCFHIPPALSVKILETAADLVRKKIKGKLDGKDLYE